jgi:anti-sigma factor RsiW
MIASIKENDELQMNAYCDGELDPPSAIEFERRLADDESLKARYNRLLSLRRAVRSLPQYELPPGLQARIQSALKSDESSGPCGTSGAGGTSAPAKLVVSSVGCGSGVWRGDLEFRDADDRALQSARGCCP